jgi:streptomycin 6-kinase
MSQFTAWRDGGGIADIPALTNAVPDFETAAIGASLGVLSNADVDQLKTAAAALLAAAKRGQANPPPSCVPGLRADHTAAMTGFKKGAQGALDAVKAARSGDMQTAAGEIKAAAKMIHAGSKAMDAAVTDMETFEASG